MLKKTFHRLSDFAVKHRVVSVVILLLAVSGIYFGFKAVWGASTETRYVLAQAELGTIMSTVSGTGQVSASNQVDIKSKASGDVLAVNIKNGQAIKKNDLLVQLNAKDAYKTVRDALTSLETARLALDKLKQPADELTIMLAENSLAQAEDSVRKAEDNITKGYEDSFNAVSDAFLDFPTIIAGLYDIQYGTGIGASEPTIGRSQDNNSALTNSLSPDDWNKLIPFQTAAMADYQIARVKYDANFTNYRDINRSAKAIEVEALLAETLDTARAMAQAAKSEINYLDTWVDLRTNSGWTIFTQVKTYQSNLGSYMGQTNNHLSTLLSLQSSIKSNIQSKADAQSSVLEKTASLADIKAGVDPLDLRSSELSYQSRVYALSDAQETYANYSVRAPFDGLVASVSVKLGDSVSSGAAITTLITPQKIATISVNEVDVAKIKIGQKTTLTFDAVSDLSISGEVIDVDTLGANSQGVVSYNVKIGFDTQDDRIKPGMSVSATIITAIKQDIIIVSNAAIKSQGTGNYVLVLSDVDEMAANSSLGVLSVSAPESRMVEIGVSDDNNTEIISGLAEGEYVVTKTTTAAVAASTSQAPSLLQSLGAGARTSGGANTQFKTNNGGASGAVRSGN